jgi:hypothetical protein
MEAVVSANPVLLAANLESLDLEFLDHRAQGGLALLLNATDAELALTLQSHLLREPSQPAIAIREQVDYLMRYCSMLELASLTGTIPDPLPQTLADQMRTILSRPAVRRYYERYYPILLPQFLLRRLSGKPLRASFEGDGMALLSRFINVSSLREGKDPEMFLAFLDDFITIDGRGRADVLRILQNGPDFVRSMTTRHPDAIDTGVRGFVAFLSFSSALNAFLLELRHSPLLQSAFWHYHGYWFQQIGGQVLGVITAGVETLRSYVDVEPADDGVRAEMRETHASMDASIRDLQMLTSAIYRYPLELALYDFTAL